MTSPSPSRTTTTVRRAKRAAQETLRTEAYNDLSCARDSAAPGWRYLE